MSRVPLLAVVVLLAAPLAGCVAGSDAEEVSAGGEEPEILVQGRGSFVTNPTTFVARNETTWDDELGRLWAFYHGSERSLPNDTEASGLLPEQPDFSEEMAVVHFAGETQGCAGVEIENVTGPDPGTPEAARDLIVGIEEFRVVSNGTTCESSSPMQIVTVPQMDGDLVTVVRHQTYASPPSGWASEFSSNGTISEERSGEGISREAPPGDPDAQRGSVGHETLDYGSDSEITQRREVVVRNESQWRDLWEEHTREDRPLPSVDFEDRMVVAVFHGSAPNGCHDIEIERITLGGDGENLTVSVREDVQDSGRCTQQVVYPYHIVELHRFDGDVAFEWEEPADTA